jgi:hypothetical protein
MKFWIVTSTRGMKNPELCDICFETNVKQLILIAKGGLRSDDVLGVYGNDHHNPGHAEMAAKEHAEEVLKSHQALKSLDRTT